MNKFNLAVLVLSAAIVSTGCSSVEKTVKDAYKDADDKSSKAFNERYSKRSVMTYHNKPYVSVRPSQNKDLDLPSFFKKHFPFATSKPVDIGHIAQRITQVIKVPVHIQENVYGIEDNASSILPPPYSSSNEGGSGDSTSGNIQVTTPFPVDTAINTSSSGSIKIVVDYSGSLKGYLDYISARLNIGWSWESNRIVFSKTITRTFILPIFADETTVEMSIGGNISTGDEGSDNNTSNTNQITSIKMKQDVITNIKNTVKAMLSSHGKVDINQLSGTVIVTDTPVNMSRVARYLESEKNSLSQQVMIEVQVLAVDREYSDQFEIDLNLLYQSSNAGASSSVPSLISGGSLGNLNLEVLRSTSPFRGTTFDINSLVKKKYVSLVTTAVTTTLNNQPAPIQVTRNIGYLKEVQSIVTEGVSGSQKSLLAGTVTTGFLMMVVPKVINEDHLVLRFSIDISNLLGFNTEVSGDDSISTPDIDKRTFVQTVVLKSNDTLVMSGFESMNKRTERGGFLHHKNPLQGSRDSLLSNTRLVIVMRPVLIGGAF